MMRCTISLNIKGTGHRLMSDLQHITDGKVVTMQYALTSAQGVVVREASGAPVSYLHGAGILFSKLEQALAKHAVGDIVTVRLLPDDAFGKRDIELLHEVPVDDFPPGEDIRVGGKVTGHNENGDTVDFTVTDIRDGIAYLDGNHPLAGQTLVFEVEIQAIRDASGEELAQGRVLD
jgi:FKBP-type peptidyl-prolyl cis-trans isomerase SlyD